MNRLKEKYVKTIVSDLMSKHNYKNVMEVPKLEKIVVNIGCGDATSNSKLLEGGKLKWRQEKEQSAPSVPSVPEMTDAAERSASSAQIR